MKLPIRRAALAAVFALLPLALHAQVPQILNYQGRVAVGTVNFDGSGAFKFALVNATGTTTYWSNDATSIAGSPPTAAVPLTVTRGLYSVLLGDTALAGMAAIPNSVFANADVRLRVWFDDGTNGPQLLTPDQRLAAVGYAMTAGTVPDGAITSAKLAAGAVGASQLASGLTLGGTTAGTFSGPLAGNATTAGSATNFTGSLAGNVTGTQAATVVATVGGITATNIALGANLSNAATHLNTASTLVKRDATGNFTAGTITASLSGNATTATGFTGSVLGDVTGTQSATSIAAATVTGKVLTGFTSTTGAITATDTVLTALNKLNGNVALKAPLASPTFTGTLTLPAGSLALAPLKLQTGVNLTAPVFGAVEFDGTNLFLSNNNVTPTRKTVAYTDSAISASQIPAGSIDATKIADGTVTSLELATGLTLGGTTAGIFSGSGAALTGLNAANLSTGTVADARLSSSVVLLTATQTLTNKTITGTFTGPLTGNASGSAASFTGALAGNVTGTQGATVVATVGGVTAANVALGANSANAATNLNTAGTIVERDASGNFAAGTITANLTGSATGFTGALVGNVTGTQGATVVASVGGVTAANVAAGSNMAIAATNLNTAGTLVKRDATGNFAVGTITGNLAGNATNFTGSLAGNVTGTQGATVVATIGGVTAANVALGVNSANAATNLNTVGTIVERDASGNFAAGIVTANQVLFADQGQIRCFDDNHRILFRRSENKLELREYGDLIFSPGATTGIETAKVVMLGTGNVGIGIAIPTTKLDVNGGIKGTTGNFTGGVSSTTGAFTGAVTGTTGTFTGEVTATVVTITGGSDVAEPYEVAGVGEVQPLPGMVVAIQPERIGEMRVTSEAYDRTVAGILSGANGIAPGITLRQTGTIADGALPVASIGRVWCWCDADANGPVKAGDLLTTSDTPGHAMRATDRERRDGAVIGKAMSALPSGRGLVFVLVSLK